MTRLLCGTTLIFGLVAAQACSSNSAAPVAQDAGPACDESKCDPGNKCIDDGSGKGPQCHKTCTKQGDCPYNWTCNDGSDSSNGLYWCVQDTQQYTAGKGTWGEPCQPGGSNAVKNNPACDTSQNFWCHAISPADANAFCTQYGCAADTDCPGGWYCATVNFAPNATQGTRSLSQTQTVCLPRGYCSACKTNHDCAKTDTGLLQRCEQDAQGNGFCTPECGADTDCHWDAKCNGEGFSVCTPAAGSACASDDDCPLDSSGFAQHCEQGKCTLECGSAADCTDSSQKCTKVSGCFPRAGACAFDGSHGFCSPCLSDADCSNGYCMDADYSQEKFCSQKSSQSGCPTQQLNPPGCPAVASGNNWKSTACTKTPPDQCVGVVTFGTGAGNPYNVLGCWTKNR